MGAQSVAIVGGGNMGRALISGLLRRGMLPEDVRVAEVCADARASLTRDFAVSAHEDARVAIAAAAVIVIAVKPQHVAALIAPLQALLLQEWCGADVPVIRAMPNRPALVGAGVTGVFAGPRIGRTEREAAARVLGAVGEIVWLENEAALDVVTALSGSGPAYLFLLAEAMMHAAVALGLEGEAARKLTVGTLYGAGLLAQSSDGDLARLRHDVTSAGGTTEAALKMVWAADLSGTVMQAVQAAAHRSRELAREFG
jgi:pyrroline-5-carboxylate reductase